MNVSAILFARLLLVTKAVDKGFDYDPGHSDLDDEQPIHVRMTLGRYREAHRLINELVEDEVKSS